MSRPLRTVLVAGLLLSFATHAHGAPRLWWKKGWEYRKIVEVLPEQRDPDARAAWVSIGAGGHALPDGGDIRVVTTRGEVLPHAVLGVGPGDRVEVAFEPKGAGPFHVYYGNPSPSRPREAWRPDRGLVLETRSYDGGEPRNLAAMRAIIAASKTVHGARRWDRVFDAINPFGPDDDFVSVYRGRIFIPNDGTYRFSTLSDGASFLLIDGKQVTRWPGWHAADAGPQRGWPGFRGRAGSVALTKGLHEFEYLHVVRTGGQRRGAYWQRPGARKLTVIPAGAFPGLHDAEVIGCEKRGLAVTADFREEEEGKIGYAERVLTGYRMWARETGEGEPVRYRWDFGDGVTAEGSSPRHVYLHGGLFRVRLEAEGPSGGDVTERTLYVAGVWTFRDRNRPGVREGFQALIREYDFARMDEASVRVAAFLLTEARDDSTLLRLYREVVLTPNETVRAAEIARMALLLGDLECDVSGDLRAALTAYGKAGGGGRRAMASSRVRQAQAIVMLGDDVKPAVDLLTDLLDSRDLYREDRRRAWIALGEAWMVLKDIDEAREAFDEARRYTGERRLGADRIRAGAASRKASTHMQAEHWHQALEEIDEWEALDPPARLTGYSTVLRAECEIALGRHARARRRLGTLLALDARGNYAARALWLTARSHEAKGEAAAAIEVYDRLTTDHRDSPLAGAAAKEAARLRGR